MDTNMIPEEKSDGDLLKEFLSEGKESAFETIVRRHGNMIYGVCLRNIRDVHEAQDAAQAVFLMLAQKAASIQDRNSVGGWLYHVAWNISSRVRASRQLRTVREHEATTMNIETEEQSQDRKDEVRFLLDQEIHSLPDKYRIPVILHHLEERSQKEIAQTLGLTANVVAVRLMRAKEMLNKKLVRQGVALSIPAMVGLFAENASAATMPEGFVASTVKISSMISKGSAATSSTVSAKTLGFLKTATSMFFMEKIKWVTLFLGSLLVATGGVSLLSHGKNKQQHLQDLNESLLQASWDDNITRVNSLLSEGGNPNFALTSTRDEQWTPLMAASSAGNFDVVQSLLQNKANPNASNGQGNTPLMKAALKGHLDIVQLLVAKGADVNAQTADGKSTLSIARESTKRTREEIVNFLIQSGAKD